MKIMMMKMLRFASCLGCVAAFVIATGSVVYANDPYARPPGIGPSSATLAQVIAAAKKAYGWDARYSTRLEEGRVSAWGLQGTFREFEAGDDFKTVVDLGVVSWQNGRSSGQSWRRNENGLVTMLHDEPQSTDLSPQEMVGVALADSSGLVLLGETSGAQASYVVEALHSGWRHPGWLLFDKSTHLVTREEIPLWDKRLIFTFSDFRKTGTRTDPWREQFSDGVAHNDLDYVTTSVRYDAGVDAADLAIPQSNDRLVRFPAGANVAALPSRIIDKGSRTQILSTEDSSHDITMPGNMTRTYVLQGAPDPHLVVQVTIGDRGYDFFLDSGASGIYMDSDVAAKLGLKVFGPLQQSSYGKWDPAFALVPQMRVGTIEMDNVIVNTLPGWQADPHVGTQIVGLLGYDFIANAVLTIDYDKGSVVATNPFMFVPPPDAIAVPAVFDEGIPFIPAQIGASSGDRFILDTGASNCFLFQGFADAHPQDVKDQGKGVSVNHLWLPWHGFQGVGGDLTVRATEVGALTVSGVTFNDWLMFVDMSQRSQDVTSDGLIGNDFLKYFTVYLDYSQNQIFLQPNSLGKSKIQH